MKKVLIILISILTLTSCAPKSAKEAVKDYLDMYITLNDNVLNELDEVVENQSLNDTQKEKYKEIVKKEYSSIGYEFVSEKYEEDYAYVNTRIKVLDLYKAQSEAITYFNQNKNEFYDENGLYNRSKFTDYKLDKMNNTEDFVSYEVEFKLIKDNNTWRVLQLSNNDLEKLHGIYSAN